MEDGDINAARLTLEPAHGGDLAIEQLDERVVEQWKSRRSGRTWSLREIVTSVLPDLYVAVGPIHAQVKASYRFRAEGQIQWSKEAEGLFRRLKSIDSETFTVDVLDDTTRKTYLPGYNGRMTERGFILWIAEQVSAVLTKRDLEESKSVFHCKLCHLLANFEVPPPSSVTALEREIDALLRPWVDYSEEVTAKRNELCGQVLRLAASGHTVIDPRNLLQSVGLTAVPLSDWDRIRSNLNTLARESVKEVIRYHQSHDVRSPPAWPDSSPVLVITGGSGNGKSWQLASLIPHATVKGACVFLRSRNDADRDLEQIARCVWHEGAKHDKPPMPLPRLAERLRESHPELPAPWLTALVDEVRSPEQAYLLAQHPWSDWDVRLVMTVSEDVSNWLEKRLLSHVTFARCQPFTERELREYLLRRRRDWGSIPADVRQHLRYPLLAGLYCELNQQLSWHPENEYDIFARIWDLLRTHPLQAEFPEDQTFLRELALGALGPGATYPWTPKQCRTAGFDTAAITRLERVGWLNRVHDRIAIRHDRLLNWAVAEALSDQLRYDGPAAADDVCRTLREVIGSETHTLGRRLNCAFMDLLYLVCSFDHPARDVASQLLRAIEQAFSPSFHLRELYKELLPTLGDRAVEAVVGRVRAIENSDPAYLPALAAQTLTRIGTTAATAAAVSLLSAENEAACDVGVRALCRRPSIQALDALWSLFKKIEQTPNDPQQGTSHSHRRSSCRRALRACAAQSPDWVLGAVERDGADPTSASLLASCLSRTDGNAAKYVWERARKRLVETLHSGSKPLADCIERFADDRYVDLMASWVASGDPRNLNAGLPAICAIAPARVLPLVKTIPIECLTWDPRSIDEFYATCPVELGEHLREAMLQPSRGAALAAYAYSGRSHWLSSANFQALIQSLEKLLDAEEESGRNNDRTVLRILDVLAQVSTVGLLEEFRALAGSEFEAKLASRSQQWLDNLEPGHEQKLQKSQKVLLRIGGPGLTRFINGQLRSPRQEVRLQGIQNAVIRPNKETVNLLCEITRSEELYESSHPRSPILQRRATESLAALGEDHALTEAILAHGADVETILHLRDGQTTMSDADISAAITIIQGGSAGSLANALLAVGISGRRDLIPLIYEALDATDPDSDDRMSALWALYGLNANDDLAVAIFSKHLMLYRLRHVALAGLLQTERADARQLLLEGLRDADPSHPLSGDGWLPGALADYPDTREEALRFIWLSQKETSAFHHMFRDAGLVEFLGDVQDDDVRDYLLQEAVPFEGNSNVVGRRRGVIRALAKQDPDAAYEATAAALVNGRHDRHLYPALLVKIDAKRAIPFLSQHLCEETNLLVRRAICLSLRQSSRRELVTEGVSKLLSGALSARLAAAEIIRWVGEPILKDAFSDVIEREELPHLRRAFRDADRFHEVEQAAREVLDRLSTASGLDQWRLIDAIFELAPPECLGNRDDPLWIGHYFDRFSPALQNHINERYRAGCDSIKRELRNRDQD